MPSVQEKITPGAFCAPEGHLLFIARLRYVFCWILLPTYLTGVTYAFMSFIIVMIVSLLNLRVAEFVVLPAFLIPFEFLLLQVVEI